MTFSRNARLAAWLAAITLFAPTAHAQGVKVNGKEIPQSRVDALVKAQQAQGQQDTPELRARIKDTLVNQEIVAQEAIKKGLDKRADVTAQLEITRQEILANAYMQDYLRNNPITEDALKTEYERIKARLGSKEYKARHILVDTQPEAEEAITRIKGGESFEKVAGEKSKDPGSKQKGGELGWAPPSTYVKPFADTLVRLKKGQMTESPVQSNFGWHVIRLDDERALRIPSYDEVKPQLQQQLMQQAARKVILDLRAKAKVE
jgi:peptidyl-prolyl cis-trans isomerase C